jgi:hypothetical protein
MHSTDCIILMRARPTKKCHQTITGVVRNLAFVSGDRRTADFSIRVNQRPKIFRIQSFRQFGRAYEITKHDCDLTYFRLAIL